MAIEKVRPIDRVLEIFYSFAAVPVLLGALFKLTHTTPFGSPNSWLYVGLGTEALVFLTFGLLYWIAPPKAVDEMGVPINGTVSNGSAAGKFAIGQANQKISSSTVDAMLASAGVTPESMEKLNSGFKNLEASLSQISDVGNTIASSEEYTKKLQEAAASLGNINIFYNKLSETASALVSSAEDARRTQEQIGMLAQNLSRLNQVYAGMLSAMQVNK